jgi:predicted transcriptional regulator
LRGSALKTFSSLINHCKNTGIVDEEIKKTRKGLQNVTMDYIKALVVIYTQQ